MQEQNELSDSISVAMLIGLSIAVLLTALWFILSLVTGDFSLSPLAIRAFLVLTALGCALGYVIGKLAFAKKDFAPPSHLHLISNPVPDRGRLPQSESRRKHPHSEVKRRPAS